MWTLNPEERIREWRHFRIDLSTQNEVECIYSVSKFWAEAPLSNQFLSHDLPENWPDPWELLQDNYYDDIGIALGIFYTLLLSDIFDKDDIVLNILQGTEGIVPVVQIGDYVLNFDVGDVVNTSQITDYKIVYQYNHRDFDVK